MNTPHKNTNIAVVTSKLIGRILKMSIEDRRNLLSELERREQNQKIRKYDRKDHLLHIDYTINKRFYNGFGINLSAGGAFIESPKSVLPNFSPGDQIILSFEHPNKQGHMKITGEIARIAENGIGVMFNQEILDWWSD